jgi:hypothetical protein
VIFRGSGLRIGTLLYTHSPCIFLITVRPKFRVVPINTTVVEGQSAMIHCVAIGEPKPRIYWDKNYYQNSFDPSRIQVW